MHMVLRREIGQARNEFLSMIHGGPKITRVRWKITWYRNFHLMVVELCYSDFKKKGVYYKGVIFNKITILKIF